MKLFIMRHGPAEDPTSDMRDRDRALTESGRDRVRSVARTLVESGEAPLSIFSSPFVRALETAHLVARASGVDIPPHAIETCQELVPEGDATRFARGFAADEGARVMLVGHEPQLTELVGRLLGTHAPVTMQKAMVVGFELPADAANATLRFILDPKSLTMTRR